MSALEIKLSYVLFMLRVGVFFYLLVWALDKLIRPSHGQMVFKNYYHLPELSLRMVNMIGIVELLILFAFVVGYKQSMTYAAIIIIHGLATFVYFLNPWIWSQLAFYASWPVLAVCISLYILREYDVLLIVKGG